MIYRSEGKKNTQRIEKNGNGDPIFKDGKGGLYMTENTNEDICVSDTNAELVIVLDKNRQSSISIRWRVGRKKK